MGDRKRRKKNKQRGERTHGQGDTKNNRGAGCRGGRGKAGGSKGKFASIGRFLERKHRLKARTKGQCISLGDLDQKIDSLVEKGRVIKEKDTYVIETMSGYETILGQGNTDKKLIVRINASKKAIEKIKKAKGRFEYNKKGIEQEEEIEDDEDLEFEAEEEAE